MENKPTEIVKLSNSAFARYLIYRLDQLMLTELRELENALEADRKQPNYKLNKALLKEVQKGISHLQRFIYVLK